MKISLNFTPFRRLIRPLSIYSETTRSKSLDSKVKWKIDENIHIFAYQQPRYQTRLTHIKLNESCVQTANNNNFEFLTEAPNTRGLGTATGGNKIVIETEPEQDYLLIRTDNLKYHIKKSKQTHDLDIEKNYLPMDEIKISGSILKDRLQKHVHISPSGPIRLNIKSNSAEFVSKTEIEEASLDITDNVTIHSENRSYEYSYDMYLLSEVLKKYPINKKINILVNDNLINLRYVIGDNLGTINYYQQGKIDTSNHY